MFSDRNDALAGLRALWVANAGAAEITLNSIRSFLAVAPDLEPRIHVGCIDQTAIEYFSRHLPNARLLNIAEMPDWRTFAEVEVEGDYSDYGTVKFRDVSFGRYFALMRLMGEEDAPILYTDGDIVFLRDPRPDLIKAAATPGASVLFQSDLPLRPDSQHDEAGHLIRPAGLKMHHCTGFSVWSSAARTRELSLQIIANRDVAKDDTHDQEALSNMPMDTLQDVATLPDELFPNGSYFFLRDGAFKFPMEVIKQRIAKATIIHANFMVGVAAKSHALKRLGLWRL